MNYKIVVLLVACMAVAMAAGCTGLTAGSSGKTQVSQEVIHTAVPTIGYSLSEDSVTYAANVPKPARLTQGGSPGSGLSTTDTKIIKTADITIEVKDVTGSVESLKSLAAAQGGYLSSTSVQKNYNNQLSGRATIRVPQSAFDTTIAGIKGLGTVKSISTSGQDVTEEYVDLQAQKTSYTNQLNQYNAIMKQSTRVEDIIKVQEQIDRVQTELDRLNGRLNYLDNRIDISTISVYLQEPEPVGGQAGHDFVATLNEGIAGFFGMIDALIVLLFTLLPLIVLGLIGYGAYRWHKGKHPKTPVSADEIKDKN